MLISTTALLAFIFTPFSIIALINAMVVPNTKIMRSSIGLIGIGFGCLSVYWTFRSLGWIEVGESIPTLLVSLFFILVVIGLYAVIGTPLLLHLLDRESKKP